MNTGEFASVQIESVKLRNFRGVASLDLNLEPELTLLVGANNSGKSRVLRAIAIALAAEQAQLDDLTVGSDEPATIDLVIAPRGGDVFDAPVGRRLGDGVQVVQEQPLTERFAWRTTLRRSAEGYGARADARRLTWDTGQQEWIALSSAVSLTGNDRSVLAAHLVVTGRDLVEELTRRGSPVRRVLSDLEVAPADRDALEKDLAAIGERIVAKSATLDAVTRALATLEDAVDGIGKPAISPVPPRIEELARSVAIDLDAGTGALPIRLHGAGARSLASLQVQSVLYDRRLGSDGTSLRPAPVTLVEEPETHLHPQATFELAALLKGMSGQVIATTHSTHVVTACDPRLVRLIRRSGNSVSVIDLRPVDDAADASTLPRARRPGLHLQEMEKLKRLVERPFGELLFASAVVVGDGATERAFLPPLLRSALGPSGAGICVIDPGSMSSELAVAAVKFAQLVELPWVLFADADVAGQRDAERLVDRVGDGDRSRLIVGGSSSDLGTPKGATEAMMLSFDPGLCRRACASLGVADAGDASALDLLKRVKGTAGAAMAAELLESNPLPEHWPTPLQDLVNKLRTMLA